MKSLELRLLGLFSALMKDVSSYYPKDAIEWIRDESRLRSVMKFRGSKFFTIDLVACGKHFDRCLSTRTFIPSGLPYQRARKKGSVIPGLFQGLLRKVFHDDGTLRNDVDVTAISLTRQLYYAAKKVKHDCEPSATFKTVAEFFDVEKEIRHPTCFWDGDDLGINDSLHLHLGDACQSAIPGKAQLELPLNDGNKSHSPSFSAVLDICQKLSDMLSCDLGDLPWSTVISKHGPGAVSDQKKGKSKYVFPNWPLKLELEFPAVGFAISSESLWQDVLETGYPQLSVAEPPSKLIDVPKTQKGPRLIASEPTAHQWMQQGVRSSLLQAIERTILGTSIHFRDQGFSQSGALRASALGHGCTIDLSSASDRLSCWVVERVFRANQVLLRYLHSTRTRWLVNDIDKKQPQFLKLRKFAPMGSALTFPIQSCVYAIISIACALVAQHGVEKLLKARPSKLRSLARKASRVVIVFGDDIIVPEGSYSLVSEVLSYLGLKVNADKTFVGGNFYESCGVDAYAGVDVTPTYFLQYPEESDPTSVVSAVECSNNFHKEGLWCTAQWIVDQLPQKYRNFIGIDQLDDGTFGLKSFTGRFNTTLKERWNEDLQCWEQLRLGLKTSSSRNPDEGIGALLQYYTEDPGPDVKWSAGVLRQSTTKLARVWRRSPAPRTDSIEVPYLKVEVPRGRNYFAHDRARASLATQSKSYAEVSASEIPWSLEAECDLLDH